MLFILVLIQGLIAYIYITGQKETNKKFDKLFELFGGKRDKTDCEILHGAKK
jgi:hypothetical protein